MKAIDLFSGAGGFSLGMRWAGIHTIEAIDIDKSAANTYNTNLGLGVCRNRSIAGWLPDLEDVDLVYGSPPCQSYSSQGKRVPQDPRGALVWEFLRVVREVRPRYFAMENVLGLTQGHGAKVLADLKEGLEATGYVVQNPWVLNAYHFGVPQNRTRVFLVGCLHGTPIPLQPTAVPLADRRTAGVVLTSLETEITNHSTDVIERFNDCPPGTKERVSWFQRLSQGEPAPTITASGRFIHPTQPRILTPRECARLQSFPDSFSLPSSKVDAYKQVGNAVPCLLAKAVGASLKP